MTEFEFLEELARSPRRWEVRPSGAIRVGRSGTPDLLSCCPIVEVCARVRGMRFGNLAWESAARELELSTDVAISIVNATDNHAGGLGSDELRDALLRACGIPS